MECMNRKWWLSHDLRVEFWPSDTERSSVGHSCQPTWKVSGPNQLNQLKLELDKGLLQVPNEQASITIVTHVSEVLFMEGR